MSGCIEKGNCEICSTNVELRRTYFYYDVCCECCSGSRHFEIVRHCKDCEPKPPTRVTVSLHPVQKEER